MTPIAELPDAPGSRPGSVIEVLLAFLKLGLTSFGGPVAHIGYFRHEFVVRRRWLDEHAYAQIVALCQFLPGPASSQVGLTIGLLRAGYAGSIAAWAGFTLPSAIALWLFARAAGALDGPVAAGLMHGLKLIAVAIVANAVCDMARMLCSDRERLLIAALSAAIILLVGSPVAQMVVIAMGALLGARLCRAAPGAPEESRFTVPVSRRVGFTALAAFFMLLAGLPLLRILDPAPAIALADAFYRSGALVFGGGHVVLPLLHEAFVTGGWVAEDAFLAGYGAAQAVPGPLFAFGAYLGAVAMPTPHASGGAALGLICIFLPGVLILFAALPFWSAVRQRKPARAMMRGVNAAVVGLVGAALAGLVSAGAVATVADAVVAVAGFALLTIWRVPALLVVLATVFASVVLAIA